MGLPTITVCGNVQKIETKQVGDKQLTTVNVSCGDKNKKGEWENLYIKADFWGDASNFVSKWFKDGSAITVTGKIYTSNYARQDGTKVYETKFLFPQASFVPKDKDSTQSNDNYSQPAPQPTSNIPEIDINEDDIPF